MHHTLHWLFILKECSNICSTLFVYQNSFIFAQTLSSKNLNHVYHFSNLSTYCNECFLISLKSTGPYVAQNFKIIPSAAQLFQTHPFATAYNPNLRIKLQSK